MDDYEFAKEDGFEVIECETNLEKIDDPDVFFNWFESKFVRGKMFGIGDRDFHMNAGVLIPLRKGDTITIPIPSPKRSILEIQAIKSIHGGIDVKARCRTKSQEFASLFRDVWKEIAIKQPSSIDAPTVAAVNSEIEKSANQLLAPNKTKPFSEHPEITERQNKVRELKKQGYTDKEIAKKIGVTIKTVQREKRKLGLVKSRKKGHSNMS